MIFNALVTVCLAPVAWVAVRELRFASTTEFPEHSGWRDIRRHEDIGTSLLHLLMLLMPILSFAIFLTLTLMEMFA